MLRTLVTRRSQYVSQENAVYAVGSSFLSVSRRSTPRAGSEAGHSVVWVRGEHDISTTPALSDTIARAIALDEPDVLVDLSEVQFMSAATVGVLIRARELLDRQSRTLTLRAPSACVLRVLEVCGLSGIFRAAESDQRAAPKKVPSALGSWVEVPVSHPVAAHAGQSGRTVGNVSQQVRADDAAVAKPVTASVCGS
jgi:anti-anti-sigma factor